MVAITLKKYRAIVLTALLSILIAPIAFGENYEEMVAQSRALANREDSLSRSVATRREMLSTAGDNRAEVSAEIVQLELELFDVRSERSRLSSQMTSLGYSVSTSNRSGGVSAETIGDAAQISSSKLLYDKLPKEDYENLKFAEQSEAECGAIFAEYMQSYNRLRELKQLYDQAANEDEAIGYSEEFHPLMSSADSLSRLLASSWGEIYDNKSFAYAMALEVLGDDELLSRQTELTYEAAGKISEVEHGEQSLAALNYDYQKRAQTQFETLLSERLQLSKVTDSLRTVTAAQLKSPAAEDMSEILFTKRSFIPYEPIKFVTTTPYDAKNPIPMAEEYKRGVVYRIQFGAYKYEQLPSIFRGVVPMSKDRALGFWTYYGGSYETLAEAEEAVELCKRRGFKRPEIVRWQDGERRNLFREPLPKSDGYRVHIEGAATLSDMVKTAIKSGAPDAELSKVGADKYIVGTIGSQEAANELVEALKVADGALIYTIVAM